MIAMRSWIMNVFFCSLLLSVLDSLVPTGSSKKVLKLTGNMVLIIVMLGPVKDFGFIAEEIDLGEYRQTIDALELELSEKRIEELCERIERETEAYIETKANELGLTVHLSVDTEIINGVPVPARATVYGEKSTELSAYMETQLGITGDNQTWLITEE